MPSISSGIGCEPRLHVPCRLMGSGHRWLRFRYIPGIREYSLFCVAFGNSAKTLRRTALAPLLLLAAACCYGNSPIPNPPPPDVIKVCNLAQTVCAVSDPRIPLTRVTSVRLNRPLWTVPIYLKHFLVSNGGGTIAAFAPEWQYGNAETPFLTLYRQSGSRVMFGYWSLYADLLNSPEDSFRLRWGSLVEVNADDKFAVRSVRGEAFTFSMKDED